MVKKSTFIKIDRNILKWRWYKNQNTKALFFHLLLTVNIRDCDFEDITVHRGQTVTSFAKLSAETGLSVRQVRTALEHLKTTQEVSYVSGRKYTIVTVKNYDVYQQGARPPANCRQTSDIQPTNKRQQLKNNKEEKEEKEEGPPDFSEISSFITENHLRVNAKRFFDYYQAENWTTAGGAHVEDWRALAMSWSKRERGVCKSGYDGIKNLAED